MNDVSAEARDAHGRWTDGGGIVWESTGPGQFKAPGMPSVRLVNMDTHFGKTEALNVARTAAEVGRQLGFDPERMEITDEKRTFMLNGKEHTYGGWSNRDTGRITIVANGAAQSYPGLVAHEIMHQKYDAFSADYKQERDAVIAEPHPSSSPRNDVMKPDGTLREPYDQKYPLYQAYTAGFEGKMQKMAREDGVTDYSREWWAAHTAGTATQNQAYHETLAEMARLNLDKTKLKTYGYPAEKQPFAGPPTLKKTGFLTTKPSSDWRKLYTLVNDNWKKRHTK